MVEKYRSIKEQIAEIPQQMEEITGLYQAIEAQVKADKEVLAEIMAADAVSNTKIADYAKYIKFISDKLNNRDAPTQFVFNANKIIDAAKKVLNNFKKKNPNDEIVNGKQKAIDDAGKKIEIIRNEIDQFKTHFKMNKKELEDKCNKFIHALINAKQSLEEKEKTPSQTQDLLKDTPSATAIEEELKKIREEQAKQQQEQINQQAGIE